MEGRAPVSGWLLFGWAGWLVLVAAFLPIFMFGLFTLPLCDGPAAACVSVAAQVYGITLGYLFLLVIFVRALVRRRFGPGLRALMSVLLALEGWLALTMLVWRR